MQTFMNEQKHTNVPWPAVLRLTSMSARRVVMFEIILNVFQTHTVKHDCRRVLGHMYKVHRGRRGFNDVTAKLQRTIYVTETAALSLLPAAIKGSGALLVPQRSAERCSCLCRHQYQKHHCSSCILLFLCWSLRENTHTHAHPQWIKPINHPVLICSVSLAPL